MQIHNKRCKCGEMLSVLLQISPIKTAFVTILFGLELNCHTSMIYQPHTYSCYIRVNCILVTSAIDWLIEHGLTSSPAQYTLCGRWFLQVKRPIKVLKEHKEYTNNTKKQKYNKHTYKHKNTANPLVYTNMGWLGDGSHRGQGHQAWTTVGLQYPQKTSIPAALKTTTNGV